MVRTAHGLLPSRRRNKEEGQEGEEGQGGEEERSGREMGRRKGGGGKKKKQRKEEEEDQRKGCEGGERGRSRGRKLFISTTMATPITPLLLEPKAHGTELVGPWRLHQLSVPIPPYNPGGPCKSKE